jgi:hypothetical protein
MEHISITLPNLSTYTTFFPNFTVAKQSRIGTFSFTSLDPTATFRTFRSELTGQTSYKMQGNNTYAIFNYNPSTKVWSVMSDCSPYNDITYNYTTSTTNINGDTAFSSPNNISLNVINTSNLDNKGIYLNYQGSSIIEISQSAQFSPISIAPGSGNLITFNAPITCNQTVSFSADPVFNNNAILDSWLSNYINDVVNNSNTFMLTYNNYISFVSNLPVDTMYITNCNPTLTAGRYLNITGASIKTTSATISDTQLSFLSQVSLNQIPTSAINGIGNYLLTSTAASTYQTIAGMSGYLTTTSPIVSNTSQITFDGSATTTIANNLSVSSI